MNKSELVKALADQANISLDEAPLVVNTFVDSMKESLLDESLHVLLFYDVFLIQFLFYEQCDLSF